MDGNITIQKLSEQLGLTSRTLRHWEAEGLFTSLRDLDSGWRSYDNRSVALIHLTALLRNYGISLKDIRIVLESDSCQTLCSVIHHNIFILADQKRLIGSQEKSLKSLLFDLAGMRNAKLTEVDLISLLSSLSATHSMTFDKENEIMETTGNDIHVRFVTLPTMRAAYYVAINTSPEDEALTVVTDWLKEASLMGTARLFGGDMPPLPKGDGKPYGYGVLASIPDGIKVPAPLKEMNVAGGLYAVTESSDDIASSWKKLMKYLSHHEEYTPDRTRLCFEEHIRNDAPAGSGHDYFLNLMEPVTRK